MLKYAKILNNKTGLCEVGVGTNSQFYKSIGMIETDVKQSDIDGNWYLSEKCPMKTDEEKSKEERERLNMLSLTAADVERAIYKAKGMDFEDVINLVGDQGDGDQVTKIDLKALKIELKANNFYRGNPYIDQVGALLGFTPEMLDRFFESGEWEELVKVEDVEFPPEEDNITNNEVENEA